jgi:2'-5' RNA ligase
LFFVGDAWHTARMDSDRKRLFIGAEVDAPWPEAYPRGRLVEASARHVTLAFLGDTALSEVREMPRPPFRIGPTGIADRLLFLPERHPRVAAYHVVWSPPLDVYYTELRRWLTASGHPVDDRELLSHVTVAREPFDPEEWKRVFAPLPCVIRAIHLYESVGGLTYRPLRSLPLLLPFEEVAHTADLAFLIRGASPEELHRHAEIALAFSFPPLISYMEEAKGSTLDLAIIALNEWIARADGRVGCPFKAVSFHGEAEERQGLLHWEMIVDV